MGEKETQSVGSKEVEGGEAPKAKPDPNVKAPEGHIVQSGEVSEPQQKPDSTVQAPKGHLVSEGYDPSEAEAEAQKKNEE